MMSKEEFEQLSIYELEEPNSNSIKKVKYTWTQLEEDLEEFIKICKITDKKFTGVYGLPRGGLIPAIMISHKLNIPLLMAPCDNCLIVDDIADSGRSLYHYTENDTQFNKYYIFTLYYAKRSIVKPDYYVRFKPHNEWVIFPWEVD